MLLVRACGQLPAVRTSDNVAGPTIDAALPAVTDCMVAPGRASELVAAGALPCLLPLPPLPVSQLPWTPPWAPPHLTQLPPPLLCSQLPHEIRRGQVEKLLEVRTDRQRSGRFSRASRPPPRLSTTTSACLSSA